LKRRIIEAFFDVSYATKKDPTMTHRKGWTVLDDLTDLLIKHGPTAMASALATLMSHAMRIERERTL
jgi:hypothetical protein